MESELLGPAGGRMKEKQGQTRALGSWVIKKILGLGVPTVVVRSFVLCRISWFPRTPAVNSEPVSQ
jgi:hypothetical protein